MESEFQQVRDMVASALGIGARVGELSPDTQLLGSMPEFDSMAVVQVLTALEEYYGFLVDDDEISAETFATLRTLTEFVAGKLDR